MSCNSKTFKNEGIKYKIDQLPRNKALMKMFNMIDIGERAGSGVPELFVVWEQEGWEEPQIEERQNRRKKQRTAVRLS